MARRGELGEAVQTIMDGDALTGMARGDWRGKLSPKLQEIAERVCWLRSGGLSITGIAARMAVSPTTVRRCIVAVEPGLLGSDEAGRRGGGCPAGKYGRLSDDELRELHHRHVEAGISQKALGREIAARYASPESAAVAISNGWARLGLTARNRPQGLARCEAVTKHGPRQGQRCLRSVLTDGRFCLMHEPTRKGAVHRHAAHMRGDYVAA